MYCEKCGKPIEDGQTLCTNCSAEKTPEPVCDTFELNTADTVPAKKASKKKTGLIAGIAALVIVVAAAVGIFLNLDSINGFVDRTFQSPEEYLANVESAAIAEHSAELTRAYGMMLKNYGASVSSGETEMRLTMGDDIISYLESMMQQQGARMELDWLSQIKLSSNANVQDAAIQTMLGIGLGNTDLLSTDVIFDLDKGIMYMAVPELNKSYLSVDFSSQISPGELKNTLTQSMQFSSALVKTLPSEEDMNKLITTYADIILSCINDVEKSDDTVTIDNVSQKMVVLTAKITEKDLLNICEKILKKAEKDETLKTVITALSNYTNEMGKMNGGSYYEPVDLYRQFLDAIPSALASIEEAKGEAESDNYLKLKVYVDMKNNVRGHALTLYTNGKKEDQSFSWLTVAEGDTIYTEAKFPEIRITGEETVEKGVSEGEYTLYAEGEKIGTLEFEDVTETSGTLRLIPSEELISQTLSGSGIPTSLLGGNLALELSCSTKDAAVSYEVNILVGPKALVGLALSSKVGEGGNIAIPTNALNANNQADLIKWLQDANFSGVLKSMEDAKVPAELINLVRSYTAMFQGG